MTLSVFRFLPCLSQHWRRANPETREVDEDGSEGDASEHERELGRGLVRLHRVLTGAEGDRGRGLDERARTGADAGDRRFVGAVTSHPRSAFQRGIGGSDAIIVSGGCTSEYSY